MGLVYLDLELFMRAMRGDLLRAGFQDVKWLSLAGWTTLWMFVIGGVSGVVIGSLNELNKSLPMWLQCLIGMIVVFDIELMTGLVCNVWLKLNLWSYEGWVLNIYGQITLVYAPLWFLLTPFVIWLDDVLRFYIYDEDKPDTLFSCYKKLFTGK